MNYNAWRVTFQSSEQAAQAAFEDAKRWERMFSMAINDIIELTEAAGVRKEDQRMGGTGEALLAIAKLQARREKWKNRALAAEQLNREMTAKAVDSCMEDFRKLDRKNAAIEEERDELVSQVTGLREDVASLLRLVAKIRAAAGDPNGRLMQPELIAHIAEMRKSLQEFCIDQQQKGCLRVSEELRSGPIDWNKFGDDTREQAANVAILVGNQIRREAGGGQ